MTASFNVLSADEVRRYEAFPQEIKNEMHHRWIRDGILRGDNLTDDRVVLRKCSCGWFSWRVS